LGENSGKKNAKIIFIAAEILLLAAAVIFLRLYLTSEERNRHTEPPVSETSETTRGETERTKFPVVESIPTTTTEPEEVLPEGEPERLGEGEISSGAGEKPIEDREFAEFWESYEKFMTEKAAVIYNPDDPEYNEVIDEYRKYTRKADAYENDRTLTDEEVKYMTEAQARIAAINAEASLA
jgi:hypothetical protein